MTIKGLYRKVQELDTDKVIQKALENTKNELADVNRERMMDGITSDGKEMPHYSYISQTVYGYPNIRITLRDTGDFQNAINVDVNGDSITTGSTDWKSEMLQKRYAEYGGLFGLSGDYKRQYLVDNLGPSLRSGITSVIGLKFKR